MNEKREVTDIRTELCVNIPLLRTKTRRFYLAAEPACHPSRESRFFGSCSGSALLAFLGDSRAAQQMRTEPLISEQMRPEARWLLNGGKKKKLAYSHDQSVGSAGSATHVRYLSPRGSPGNHVTAMTSHRHTVDSVAPLWLNTQYNVIMIIISPRT